MPNIFLAVFDFTLVNIKCNSTTRSLYSAQRCWDFLWDATFGPLFYLLTFGFSRITHMARKS